MHPTKRLKTEAPDDDSLEDLDDLFDFGGDEVDLDLPLMNADGLPQSMGREDLPDLGDGDFFRDPPLFPDLLPPPLETSPFQFNGGASPFSPQGDAFPSAPQPFVFGQQNVFPQELPPLPDLPPVPGEVHGDQSALLPQGAPGAPLQPGSPFDPSPFPEMLPQGLMGQPSFPGSSSPLLTPGDDPFREDFGLPFAFDDSPLGGDFSTPLGHQDSLMHPMGTPLAPPVPLFALPTAPPLAPAPQTAPPAPQGDVSFASLLAVKGAQQQGLVSTVHGKTYEGPISMRGRRAEQLQRHLGNLVLNALQPRQGETHKAPIEIQSSLVGNKLLLNSNNLSSENQLHQMLLASGNLQNLVFGDRADQPAMDNDTARPVRYKSKLRKALAGQRKWQQTPEDPNDSVSAQRILAAMGGRVWTLNPDDADFARQLAAYKADQQNPGVLVIKHSSQDLNLQSEHAERVQSRFRSNHLGDQEDVFSTKPVGPKTPCFGCQVHHQVNHPHLADTNGLSGAYFSDGSPVTTPEERQAALQLVRNRPATGSISQKGYFRNSDYPDSDSDDEGESLPFQPETIRLQHDEDPGSEMYWSFNGGRVGVPKSRLKSKINRKYLNFRKKKAEKQALSQSSFTGT